jgi:hypothetical protein
MKMTINISVENVKKRLIHFPPSALIERYADVTGNALKVRSVVLIKISIVTIMLKLHEIGVNLHCEMYRCYTLYTNLCENCLKKYM